MITAKCYVVIIVFIVFMITLPSYTNNLNVDSPVLTGQNTSQDFTYVKFNMTWEHSWRDEINWDAAWVFVKYKETGSNEWENAYLSPIASNHIIPVAYTCSVGVTNINSTDRGIGIFIYRNSSGSGNNSISDLKLRWDYGANNLNDDATVTVKVFAIEMVYVPEGSFYVGDANASTTSCFYSYGTTNPYHITSEGLINIGQTIGYLWADRYAENSVLSAEFPKGYSPFYCMKYEISQGQYAEFLNTLTQSQVGARFPNQNGSWRHTISLSEGKYSALRPDRACNWLSWADGSAYTDWAGLRPMTELEFEKACRGTQPVVDEECSWGTSNIIAATTISGIEDGTETITNSGANCCFGNITYINGDGDKGPLRCGIFAQSATTREQAGASYYGIMELTGNMWERIITLANSTGRIFTGCHGDGSLSEGGDANVPNWPNTDSIGAGFIGGASNYTGDFEISNRLAAGYVNADRYFSYGFRSVRKAP